MITDQALMKKAAYGPSRRFAAVQRPGSSLGWSELDMLAAGPTARDPERSFWAVRCERNVRDPTFYALDALDLLQQSHCFDDQFLVGRGPSEDHLAAGNVRVEPVLAGLGAEPPVHGEAYARQDQLIPE